MANQEKLFGILAVADPVKMESRIAAEFPEANLKVGLGQWLLVTDSSMTTTEVSIKLHVTSEIGTAPEDTPGAAIVVSIMNYFGASSRTNWEWITAKMGGSDGAAG